MLPGTLRQTIAYHMVLIITNRYENLAPGMKTGHLGMKQMPKSVHKGVKKNYGGTEPDKLHTIRF